MSLISLLAALVVLAVIGYFIAAIALDRPGSVPAPMAKGYGYGFIATLTLSSLFFFGTTGAAIFGHPTFSNMFAEQINRWFPNDPLSAAVTIFGPGSLLFLVWGAVGLAFLPFYVRFTTKKLFCRNLRFA